MRCRDEAPRTLGINWGKIRLFIIDRDEKVCHDFTVFSRLYNIECNKASSTAEALATFAPSGAGSDEGRDIFFIDMETVDSAYEEVVTEIRAQYPTAAFVLMISTAEWERVEGLEADGQRLYLLAKPLFPSGTVDTINEILGGAECLSHDSCSGSRECFAGYRLLLAEDVEVNREIVLALLEPTLLEIECAENGRDALSRFEAAPDAYDIILMDVQMPEMDGYEATRRIRALEVPEAKTVPIVALTANVFKDDIAQALAAGMNGHLGKPLDLDNVLATLSQYLPAK
jgi:CheY-like chemotaxis protein